MYPYSDYERLKWLKYGWGPTGPYKVRNDFWWREIYPYDNHFERKDIPNHMYWGRGTWRDEYWWWD